MAKHSESTGRNVAPLGDALRTVQPPPEPPGPIPQEPYSVTFRWMHEGQIVERSLTVKDNPLYVHAYHWNYVVANRRRLNEKARDVLLETGMESLRELVKPIPLDDVLEQMATAGVVEVSIPYEREDKGWSARVFPWEDVLTMLTKPYRDGKPLLVIRQLACEGRAVAAARPVKKILLVASAPGKVEDLFSFDDECMMVQAALGFEPYQSNPNSNLLADPTLQDLKLSVKRFQPDVVHLAGIDVHQAEELLPDLPRMQGVRMDGFLLEGNAGGYDFAGAPELGKAINAGKLKPLLVAINCFYSGPRLAAMAVAEGARHAIGFQDTANDAIAEQIFGDFYMAWRKGGCQDILGAFAATIERHRHCPDEGAGAGVVLWSEFSLLGPAPKVKTKPKSQPKAPKVPEAWTHGALSLALKPVVEPHKSLNYSMLHNNRNLFAKFMLRVCTIHPLPPVEVEVSLHAGGNDFPFRRLYDLNEETSGRSQNLENEVRVSLVADLLRGCRESILSILRVQIRCADIVIYMRTFQVWLLSADEWQDDDLARRWLPSFVFPLDPQVPKIIGAANRYLCALQDNPSAGFDGYQQVARDHDDPEDPVLCQVQALWYALVSDFKLRYINPPPSYTKASQRLRPPSVVVKDGSGTCIDLTLLFAACLESVGIYPVVFLMPGHAFPGFWRSERARQDWQNAGAKMSEEDNPENHQASSLGQPELPDSESWMLWKPHQREALFHCVEKGDLVPFESTLVTQSASFCAALTEGARNLNTRGFECMVDIQLAREKKITPLPIILTHP